MFYAGYALAIVVRAAPQPAALARCSRGPFARSSSVRPVEGALAADSLIQAPRRTSASVAALMLSLALVVAFAGMARASYDSIIDWMETALNPDLFVMPSQRLDRADDAVPGDDGPGDRSAPRRRPRADGARRAHRVPRHAGRWSWRIEMHSVANGANDAGRRRTPEMYRQAAAGEGLIVSDNLAQLQHLKLGDVARDSGAGWVIRLPIVGIVVDYSDQQGRS